jgi:ribose-phosphate pyrophosphokinase
MRFFLTDSSKHLRQNFKKFGCELGQFESYVFADGERGYRLKVKVKGKSIVIVASILPDPESLFELMALHRLVLENGARESIFFIPYLGYARQDRPSRPGEGSIGIMVVNLLKKMNPSKLILLDIHSDRIRKVLGPRVTEISALPLFAEILKKDPPDVIVSPDAGFISKAEELADLLRTNPKVAWIDKVRPHPNVAIARRLHGDIRMKKVLVVDDMIDTAGTISEAVKLISQDGPRTIRIAATHGIFSGEARDRLSRLPTEETLVTNTLPQIRSPKLRILDITPLVLDALVRC